MEQVASNLLDSIYCMWPINRNTMPNLSLPSSLFYYVNEYKE